MLRICASTGTLAHNKCHTTKVSYTFDPTLKCIRELQHNISESDITK